VLADKTWKRRERQAADFFGGKRCPVLGDDTKADVTHDVLFVEVKERVKHSAVTLWGSVKERAVKEEKIPCVVLAEKGRPGFWLLVHSSDLTAVGNQRLEAIKNGFK
jgi:hypothetical protein